MMCHPSIVHSVLVLLLLLTACASATLSPQNRPQQRPWQRLSEAMMGRIGRLSDHQTHWSNGVSGDRLVAQYGQDLVLRFHITTPEQASALAEAVDVLFLDVWEFNDDRADIRLAKDVMPSLLGLLPSSMQNAHTPLLQDLDLAQAIVDSYPSPSGTRSHESNHFTPFLNTVPGTIKDHPFFHDYQPLSAIVPWMNLMASMFSTHVRRINIGTSYEGRSIPALRIGVHPTNREQLLAPRKTIVISAGSHAREWIATSTVNYLAWSLINKYGKDSEMTHLLQSFDFVFIPTINPDGYTYSWETDRLWRKNRQPTSLRFCRGIDLDRSYSYQWDGDSSRSNPCSESFAGDAPFEGHEARTFANWAKNETEHNNVKLVGFLDLHSYSQQVLYPYNFSCDEEPPSIEDLEELALGLAKAIRVGKRGHEYKVSSACEGNVAIVGKNKKKKLFPRIVSSGGSALDYFYHDLKVKYSYQIKLRDTGSYGFLLPRENIVPTGEEALGALLYFGRFMLNDVDLIDKETEGTPYHKKEHVSKEQKDHNDDDGRAVVDKRPSMISHDLNPADVDKAAPTSDTQIIEL